MTDRSKKLLIMSEYTLDTHFFRNVGNGLRRAGYHVVFASMKDPQAPAWMSDAGFEYFWLRAGRRWRYPAAVRRLSRIIRDNKIDILHAHLHEATLLGAAVKKINSSLKYVAGRHYTDQLVLLKKPWHVAMDRWATSVADVVTVPCKAAKDYVVEKESAPEAKIVPTYLGFDFDQFKASADGGAAIRKQFGLEGAFVIGCVARFLSLKGHDHLLNGFQQIVRKIPSAKLLLVGGGDTSKVQWLSKELGLEPSVIFAGQRADVADCMSTMDVLVHASVSESFCQVIIEGMGVGRAVVATRVGVAEEAITDGETGILISPADPEAITCAVMRLYSDPGMRQRMGQAARNSVTQRFTVENMVKDHIQCYSQLFDHK